MNAYTPPLRHPDPCSKWADIPERDDPPPAQSCPVQTREEYAFWVRTGRWWCDMSAEETAAAEARADAAVLGMVEDFTRIVRGHQRYEREFGR